VLAWSRDAGVDLTQWEVLLRQVSLIAFDALQGIIEFVTTHSEKLFGLAGFSFGVWRWWYTRERVLHKRLQEYIVEQDRRLGQARADVLEAIYRPGSKQQFADPLFAVRPLRRILRRRRWNSLFVLRSIETSAERNLKKALEDIERRYGIAVAALTSLRAQMASAHLLQGAIAAARASQSRNLAQRMYSDDKALTCFRTVLQVHDYERDVQAKEYEAHQLRKLGHLAEAQDAYEQLDDLAAWVPDEKARRLILARARRYRAQIVQANAIGGSMGARDLIVEAQNLRSIVGPFSGWEAIEQGHVHYVHAYIRNRLQNHQIEQRQLSLAETAYRKVLSHTPSSRWFVGGSTKRLRAAAQAGLSRVQEAQKHSRYDTDWLLPPSNDSQQPPTPVSDAGSS
jgi:hypothetical protein